MNPLARRQADFQAYMIGADAVAVAGIAGPDEHFRRTRLDIYRDAYRLRLTEVLESDYPALRAHLGAAAFEALATAYLAVHPSTFRNVRWFGGALPRFLRDHAGHGSPAATELAQFEWTLGLAFDAPDQEAVQFADVAAVAPEYWAGLKLQASPCLHVLKFQTNAVALWNAFNDGQALPDTQALQAPVDWAIWRKDYSPYFRSLPNDEAWALRAMRDGSTFGELCAGLCEWVNEEDAALRAAQLLRGWVEEGWIAGLNF